jgi:methylated-DNA-[protein]-cysteine S-methyltransferase
MTKLEHALKTASLPPGDAGSDAAVGLLLARAEEQGLIDVAFTSIDSPFGELLAAATPQGLVRIAYDMTPKETVLEELAATVSPRVLEAAGRLDPVKRQLDEYFGGRRKKFELKLDWRLTRGFTQRILRETAKLGYGEVSTYKGMAEAAGSPRAVRAAGNALGSNPIPIVVPCHRIVRSGGSLGGYAGLMDTDIKRRLLELEGALGPEGQARLF